MDHTPTWAVLRIDARQVQRVLTSSFTVVCILRHLVFNIVYNAFVILDAIALLEMGNL